MDLTTPKQKAVREEMERLIAKTIFDGAPEGNEEEKQMDAAIAVCAAEDVMEALIQGPLKHWWVGLR